MAGKRIAPPLEVFGVGIIENCYHSTDMQIHFSKKSRMVGLLGVPNDLYQL